MSSAQPPLATFDPSTVAIRQAEPDTFPAYARLLAEAFSGKFAIALGQDVEARARRMLTLLPSGILCPGMLYGVWQADDLLATFTLCRSRQRAAASPVHRRAPGPGGAGRVRCAPPGP